MSDDRRRSDDARIDQILSLLEGQEKLFDAKFDPIHKLLGVHDRTLFGDGSEGNQGLRVRLDRVEQAGKTRMWYLRALVGAILIAVGQSIWKMITFGSAK